MRLTRTLVMAASLALSVTFLARGAAAQAVQSSQPASDSSSSSATFTGIDEQTAADGTGATWTLHLAAPYCGGYRIGDGVYVQASLPWPARVQNQDVTIASGPSQTNLDPDSATLQVTPAPGRVWSQLCMQGQRAFDVDLLPSMGPGMLPPDDGSAVTFTVWTGANSDPVTLSWSPTPGSAS